MSRLDRHTRMVQDDNGYDTKQLLCEATPAKQEDVDFVLRQNEDSDDGRSNWMWIRLQNGDLILGVYPQGGTYKALEGKTGA